MSRYSLLTIWLLALAPTVCTGESPAKSNNSLQLTLPKKIYAAPGVEMSVYFDNIVLTKTPQAYRFDVKCNIGQTEKRRWTVTPKAEDVGDHRLTVQVSNRDGKRLSSASTTLRVIRADAGAGREIRLLIVGDSLTHATVYANEIGRLLSQPGNPRWRMQRQLERFAEKKRAKTSIVPTQLNLDPVDGYPDNNGVHPNAAGYKQIGATIYAWLKSHLAGAAGLPANDQAAQSADPPRAGEYSPAKYQVIEQRDHDAPMRDGVKLKIDIFRPKAEGRFPAVLQQTPYNKNGQVMRAKKFAARGYVVVNSDSRGRFESGGDWDPFSPKHKTDGYDLVQWIAEQKWCNGNVGTYGLSYMGWFDANFPGTPMNYLGMKQHGGSPSARRPRIVIGPWEHIINRSRVAAGVDFGEQAIIDWDGYVLRWFDHHLKGMDNGVLNDPPVHVFVMGRNQWRAAKDWPLPQTRFTKYYLHSGGKANSSRGDGTLSTAKPLTQPPDKYVYNPHHPTPSAAFANGHIDGPRDISKSAARSDVLVYQMPKLTAEVEIVGPITARLFAATSARDTICGIPIPGKTTSAWLRSFKQPGKLSFTTPTAPPTFCCR